MDSLVREADCYEIDEFAEQAVVRWEKARKIQYLVRFTCFTGIPSLASLVLGVKTSIWLIKEQISESVGMLLNTIHYTILISAMAYGLLKAYRFHQGASAKELIPLIQELSPLYTEIDSLLLARWPSALFQPPNGR